MHHRPLALVSVLVGGDYLLWNWSLQGGHDALALISGLTLTPLAIALIWLLALNTASLITRAARPRQQHRDRARQRGMQPPQQLTRHRGHQEGEQQASSSSKLAA